MTKATSGIELNDYFGDASSSSKNDMGTGGNKEVAKFPMSKKRPLSDSQDDNDEDKKGEVKEKRMKGGGAGTEEGESA